MNSKATSIMLALAFAAGCVDQATCKQASHADEALQVGVLVREDFLRESTVDASARLDQAQRLTQAGQYAEALDALCWSSHCNHCERLGRGRLPRCRGYLIARACPHSPSGFGVAIGAQQRSSELSRLVPMAR